MVIECGRSLVFRRQDGWELFLRDRYMAGKIRDILGSSRPEKLLHVGGWEHLQEGDEDTLFSILSDLHPRRRLLPR